MLFSLASFRRFFSPLLRHTDYAIARCCFILPFDDAAMPLRFMPDAADYATFAIIAIAFRAGIAAIRLLFSRCLPLLLHDMLCCYMLSLSLRALTEFIMNYNVMLLASTLCHVAIIILLSFHFVSYAAIHSAPLISCHAYADTPPCRLIAYVTATRH